MGSFFRATGRGLVLFVSVEFRVVFSFMVLRRFVEVVILFLKSFLGFRGRFFFRGCTGGRGVVIWCRYLKIDENERGLRVLRWFRG